MSAVFCVVNSRDRKIALSWLNQVYYLQKSIVNQDFGYDYIEIEYVLIDVKNLNQEKKQDEKKVLDISAKESNDKFRKNKKNGRKLKFFKRKTSHSPIQPSQLSMLGEIGANSHLQLELMKFLHRWCDQD